ncbi:AI-2E family transporter [Prosthecochloris sp. HL-130-GSB]|jgi:predicted PurR-regulated permease PerM|uniref:AI-2E family transporter n=1 Tax=Prosthecochloris sp. HL-130-GSB TaxID=1974213 RepID=UPI000A1C05C0|nr:AI-2E family transporter [Prosthecochloris sp. HL-130-GSB]ARM31571.1 AI-2E family transporter [Prosthecochloris sp. HL-130-GSB]MBO8092992.1 AI-2E family transporter [Prosthecochloris sp.]
MKRSELNNLVLLLVVLLISSIFVVMISDFLMVILMAGIFTGLAMPVYRFFEKRFHGKKSLSSGFTLATVSLIVIFPLLALLGIVAAQAIRISRLAGPWIERRLQEPPVFSELLGNLPMGDVINSYRDVIFQRAGELVSRMSSLLFENISSFTVSTLQTFFLFFVFIYTMFFFLRDGRQLLEKILYYLPLNEKDQSRMLERFVSVTRATIRGTFVVGFIQGSLAALGLHVAGIEGAAFWGAIMTVLSVIPVLGTVLVWGPAVAYLYTVGEIIPATGLLVYCGLLVGGIDNILRPILVGRDTRMHELLIFLGTIGGLGLFGIAGFIVGPIIAALFVTVWEIYGETFKEYLNPVKEE